MLRQVIERYKNNWFDNNGDEEDPRTFQMVIQTWKDLDTIHSRLKESFDVVEVIHMELIKGTLDAMMETIDQRELSNVVCHIGAYAQRVMISLAIDSEPESAIFGVLRPRSWVPLSTLSMVLWLFSEVAGATISANAPDTRRLSTVSVFDFPGVCVAGLAYTAKSVLEYTARDIVWILDAIAHHWYDVAYTPELERYILAIAVRVGLLLRGGHPPEAYTGGDCPAIPYVVPSDLHTVPRKEAVVVCGPSDLFVSFVRARLTGILCARKFIATHRRITSETAMVMATATAHSPLHEQLGDTMKQINTLTRGRRTIPTESLTIGVWGQLADVSEHAQLRPSPTPHQDAPRLWWYGGHSIAHALAVYAKNLTVEPQIHDLFVLYLVSGLIGPGDTRVYSAAINTPGHRTSTHGTIEHTYGRRALSAIRDHANHIVLNELISKVVDIYASFQSTPACPSTGRTLPGIDMWMEMAGLAAFDVLFRNHTGTNFRDRFVVQPHTLSQESVELVELPGVLAQLVTANTSLYTTLPLIVIGCNTFDVIYYGNRIQTGSIYESIALWLSIVSVSCFGKIPTTDPHSAMFKVTSDSLRDVSELCNIVTNGPEDFISSIANHSSPHSHSHLSLVNGVVSITQ